MLSDTKTVSPELKLYNLTHTHKYMNFLKFLKMYHFGIFILDLDFRSECFGCLAPSLSLRNPYKVGCLMVLPWQSLLKNRHCNPIPPPPQNNKKQNKSFSETSNGIPFIKSFLPVYPCHSLSYSFSISHIQQVLLSKTLPS